MMTKMGNDYIAKENIDKIDKVLDENYLKEVSINDGLRELAYLKDKLKKHKLDFILYFYKEFLREEAEKEDEEKKVKKLAKPSSSNEEEDETDFIVIVGFIIFGMIALVWYGFSVLPIFNKITAIIPTILAIEAVCTVPPRIFSLMCAFQKYGEIVDTIKDKLALLKERKEDLTLQREKGSLEIKAKNKVDSFIREIIKDKEKLEGLNDQDKALFRDKLVAIAKEYIEYTFRADMSSKIPSPTLKDNKEMEKLYRELITVEEEIEVSHKKNKNIEVLSDTFGDITKLDTSIVELDTALDSTLKLDRKLKK